MIQVEGIFARSTRAPCGTQRQTGGAQNGDTTYTPFMRDAC
jgi:hypothetical protein